MPLIHLQSANRISLHRLEAVRYISFGVLGTMSLTSARHHQAKLGVDHGPIHLVEAGLEQQLKDLGWRVQFDGHHQFEEISEENDPPIGKMKNPRFVSRVCKAVAGVVSNHARRGQLPVVLGGDHSLVCIHAYACAFYLGLLTSPRQWARSVEPLSTVSDRLAQISYLTIRLQGLPKCLRYMD